ncbi:MAG: hypothetical protein ACRC2T_05790 [Thermoguttaceae bacterium]
MKSRSSQEFTSRGVEKVMIALGIFICIVINTFGIKPSYAKKQIPDNPGELTFETPEKQDLVKPVPEISAVSANSSGSTSISEADKDESKNIASETSHDEILEPFSGESADADESHVDSYLSGVNADFSQLRPSRIINPQIAPGVVQAYPTRTAYTGSPSNNVVFAIPTRQMANTESNILLVQGAGAAGVGTATVPGPVQPYYRMSDAVAAEAATKPATSPWWDPFAVTNRGPLFGSSTGSNHLGTFPDTQKVMRRFIERVSLDYTYIPRGNVDKGFGYNHLAYQTEFTFPCKLMNNEPIYLAPSLDLLWWDGPFGPPKNKYNMSPNGFSAYLETGLAPRINRNFAFSLWASAGVYSDYNKITSDSFRLKGKASVMIGLTEKMEGVLGIDYINRSKVKILPQIGVIWRPNNDDKDIWRLVFPDPKITHYLTRLNDTDWSCYIQGNYSGGVWTITDHNFDNFGGGEVTLLMDYNDIRIGGGFEFKHKEWLHGYFEFGGAFGRELYTRGNAWVKPSDAVYIKAGFSF